MRGVRAAVALWSVLGVAGFSDGAVRFVKFDAAGANDGTSWADAFTSLQSALAAATAGDQVWVARGIYTPAAPGTALARSVSFQMKSGVKILGGFNGTETAAGQRNPRLNVCVLSGDINGDDVPNFGNRGDNSFRVVRASSVSSSGVLQGFVIRGGNADGTGQENAGAGIDIAGGAPSILHCIVRDNRAFRGGGIQSVNSSALLSHLVVTGNRADTVGAIDVQGPGDVLIGQCTIVANTSNFNNSAAVSYLNTTLGAVRASILWGNSNPQGQGESAQISFSNAGSAQIGGSVVQNGTSALGFGVVAHDPLFISERGADGLAGSGDEDLRLRPGSPSIDLLTSMVLDDDQGDQDGDGNTSEQVLFDAAWAPRISNDPATPNAAGNTVDHGAYEFQGTSCPGDMDGNGTVNTIDLARFLAVFGDSGEPLRVGDFNADGVVNTADLVMFLGQFGVPCTA